MANKDNRARVSFAPGKTGVYIIVKGDHEEPYPGDCGHVYTDLDEAERRAEWLNWNVASKQSGKFGHPREEQAAKREEARAQLLAAHRALLERERYGVAVATQLAALRDALQREEDLAADCELRASQEGRSAKDRKAYRQGAQQARTRAQGLARQIAELEASPALPSRLAGATQCTEQAGKEKEARGGTAP